MPSEHKQRVFDLLKSLETKDPAPFAYINPKKYIQHNLAVADGPAGVAALIRNLPPDTKVNTVRVYQDGDFVFAHTEYNFFGPKIGFDIFRFEDGLIVEHWDNLQEAATEPSPSGHNLTRTYQDMRQPSEVVTGGLAVWQQDRAIELLHKHLDGDLTLPGLAKECGLSPGRFMRGFKKSFGVPVHRYLLQRRIQAAKSVLLHSDKSLLTVALDAGFSDQPAFNRSFREIVGTSPGQWRRANTSIPKAFKLLAQG